VIDFLLKNKQYLLAIITLGLGIYIGSFFAGTKIEHRTVTVTEIQHDTLRVEVPKEVIKYVKVNVPEPYETIVYVADTTKSTRLYQANTVVEEGLKIGYDATVQGYLVDINLTYEDTRPEVIKYITKEIKIEEKNYISPSGLYVGVLASLPNRFDLVEVDAGPSVDLLLNKSIFSYSYQVVNGIHLVGYKRKLF
jgi:hypothetical protein